MGERARRLAANFLDFNNEVMAFVTHCSESDWLKVCSGEGWSVGVVAHHVAARHYAWLRLAQIIAAGETVADVDLDGVNQANERHARENSDCTREQVLDLLYQNSVAIASFVNKLDDAALDRATFVLLIGGDISTQQVIEWLIVHMSREHLASMRAAVAAQAR